MATRKWWRSIDSVVHAFEHPMPNGGRLIVAAACDHSAPKHQLMNTDEGPRCMVCKLLVEQNGDEIEDQSKGDLIDLGEQRRRRGEEL